MDYGYQGMQQDPATNLMGLYSANDPQTDANEQLLQAIRQSNQQQLQYAQPGVVGQQYQTQQGQPAEQSPLQVAGQQYQIYMAMGRPDLAQAALKTSGLPMPEESTGDQIKSMLLGTPNAWMSNPTQLASAAIPHLVNIYHNYMNNKQWGQNPQLMQGNANSQIANMQNSFGLKQ